MIPHHFDKMEIKRLEKNAIFLNKSNSDKQFQPHLARMISFKKKKSMFVFHKPIKWQR